MAVESYGVLARLPPEIRIQIYEEYFALRSSRVLKKYCTMSYAEAEIFFYVAGPDTSILRVSRAVYRETLPIKEKIFNGRPVFRTVAKLPNKQILDTAMYLRRSSQYTLYSPREDRAAPRKVHLVFPSFKYFINTKDIDADPIIQGLRKKISRHCGPNYIHLSLIIQDPTWPLPLPGEDVWYQRLYQGMTRRSLVKAREVQAATIAQQVIRLFRMWRFDISKVSFDFGDPWKGKKVAGETEFRNMIESIGKMASRIAIEY